MIHGHPIIYCYDLHFCVYIQVPCFDVNAEISQIASIIIQPIWNRHFWRLLFIFVAAIFRQDVDQRYLRCGHAHHCFEVILTNEKSQRLIVLCRWNLDWAHLTMLSCLRSIRFDSILQWCQYKCSGATYWQTGWRQTILTYVTMPTKKPKTTHVHFFLLF